MCSVNRDFANDEIKNSVSASIEQFDMSYVAVGLYGDTDWMWLGLLATMNLEYKDANMLS